VRRKVPPGSLEVNVASTMVDRRRAENRDRIVRPRPWAACWAEGLSALVQFGMGGAEAFGSAREGLSSEASQAKRVGSVGVLLVMLLKDISIL